MRRSRSIDALQFDFKLRAHEGDEEPRSSDRGASEDSQISSMSSACDTSQSNDPDLDLARASFSSLSDLRKRSAVPGPGEREPTVVSVGFLVSLLFA